MDIAVYMVGSDTYFKFRAVLADGRVVEYRDIPADVGRLDRPSLRMLARHMGLDSNRTRKRDLVIQITELLDSIGTRDTE